MKIVQLSDIHFGAQFRDDIFNQVIDEVNELSPDAVIITGDLTNEGLKDCLLYTSPSPRDMRRSRMPSSA